MCFSIALQTSLTGSIPSSIGSLTLVRYLGLSVRTVTCSRITIDSRIANLQRSCSNVGFRAGRIAVREHSRKHWIDDPPYVYFTLCKIIRLTAVVWYMEQYLSLSSPIFFCAYWQYNALTGVIPSCLSLLTRLVQLEMNVCWRTQDAAMCAVTRTDISTYAPHRL